MNEAKTVFKLLQDVSNRIKFNSTFSITNNRRTYALEYDSKILSKIYEVVLIDEMKRTLDKHKVEYIENDIQNKYPDFMVKSKKNNKYYAVDIKSSYMKNDNQINGFTLGTYNGYFKDRTSSRYSAVPYNEFMKHFCICVVYSRKGNTLQVRTKAKKVSLRDKIKNTISKAIPKTISKTKSWIKKTIPPGAISKKAKKTNVEHVFVKEKWQIASKVCGSGNTCNIGSVKDIKKLISHKKSNFCFKSEKDFDGYWLKQ
tara:strand:+ start:2145 stop:2915 length:771 start_codon:yes stop_codon:yes gene_type:complete